MSVSASLAEAGSETHQGASPFRGNPGVSPMPQRLVSTHLNKTIALNALSYAGRGSMEGETA